MKKFFSTLLILAASMICAVSLVSCGSDDDDVISSKNKVGCAIYEFSQDELDLYNIKMTATGPTGESYGTFNFNAMTPIETDEPGVKAFEIDFTIKEFPVTLKVEASCAKNVADLEDDKTYSLVHRSAAASYKTKGEGFSALKGKGERIRAKQNGAGMKRIREDGLSFYESYVRSIALVSSSIER